VDKIASDIARRAVRRAAATFRVSLVFFVFRLRALDSAGAQFTKYFAIYHTIIVSLL